MRENKIKFTFPHRSSDGSGLCVRLRKKGLVMVVGLFVFFTVYISFNIFLRRRISSIKLDKNRRSRFDLNHGIETSHSSRNGPEAIVIHTNECSQSTAVYRFVREILHRHGYEARNIREMEYEELFDSSGSMTYRDRQKVFLDQGVKRLDDWEILHSRLNQQCWPREARNTKEEVLKDLKELGGYCFPNYAERIQIRRRKREKNEIMLEKVQMISSRDFQEVNSSKIVGMFREANEKYNVVRRYSSRRVCLPYAKAFESSSRIRTIRSDAFAAAHPPQRSPRRLTYLFTVEIYLMCTRV